MPLGDPMTDELERRWDQHDREHIAAERSHRREHESDHHALSVAAEGVDRRLNELNDLRKEVITDRGQFMTVTAANAEHQAVKVEFRGKYDSLGARIDAVEKLLDRAEGAANTWRFIAGFLGIGGVGAIIWAIVNAPR